MESFGHRETVSLRTNRDLPMPALIIMLLAVVLAIWLIPSVPISLIGALVVAVFGFFFATVSSRMVGLVGASNNPISGMAIATLLLTTAIFKATGNAGYAGMASAICVGTIICIIAAMAGDTSQDLKTGYIVGATPIKQQIGELGGVLAAAVAIGGIMYLLDAAWHFGGTELPAPQATLMKLLVEGVMGGTLPFGLVFISAAVAVVIEILGLPILPIAIGIYLPIHLSVPIFAGGLLREFFVRRKNKTAGENGVLFSSGLIAGEGLIGILIAVFAIIKIGDKSLTEVINLGAPLGNIGGLAFLLVLIALIYFFSAKKNKEIKK